MTIEKSIGWTDITCNPIKGRCKGGCWYCYYSGERGIAKRFKHNPEIRLDLTVFDSLPLKPKKIFLCSTHDLFGNWISETKREIIFEKIRYHPQHTFQILTKYPQNIDREMPDNVWLGVSITKGIDIPNLIFLENTNAQIKFISYEPFLERIGVAMLSYYYFPMKEKIDWIIIGRLTGYGNKYNPKKEWIKEIVNKAKELNIPIFLKDNLKDIWGEPLIQEFPT